MGAFYVFSSLFKRTKDTVFSVSILIGTSSCSNTAHLPQHSWGATPLCCACQLHGEEGAEASQLSQQIWKEGDGIFIACQAHGLSCICENVSYISTFHSLDNFLKQVSCQSNYSTEVLTLAKSVPALLTRSGESLLGGSK